LLLYNGRILRPAGGGEVEAREWLFVERGLVSASGTGSPPKGLQADGTVLRDLKGQVVLPGLFDAHIHVFFLAKQSHAVNLEGCASIEELQERLRRHIAGEGPSIKTLAFVEGSHWDQELLGRLPTRFDLDAVCPDHPVILYRRCWHIGVVNSKALEACGITADTPTVAGGAIDRDASGELTGVLREAALELLAPLTSSESSFEQKKKLLEEGLRLCASMGITSVQTNDSKQLGAISDSWDVYSSLADEGKLPCRVFLTVSCKDVGDDAVPQGPVVHPSGLLSCDRVKLWTDGALGARTAAVIEPYSDDPGNTGILQMTPGDIDSALLEAKRRNLRIEAHAIGDRAAMALLGSFECHLSPADRPVMTHCQILSRQLVQWMSRLGVVANVQPQFVPSDATIAPSRLGVGSERFQHSYAWATLRRHGVRLAGGSDAPVEPPAPLAGMRCAMTHESSSPCGPPLRAEERLTFGEALEMYTVGAAYATRAERFLGALREGQEADFVVLAGIAGGGPPGPLSAEDLRDATPAEVWVRGSLVHSASSAAESCPVPPPPAGGAGGGAAAGKAGLLWAWRRGRCPCCV